MIFANRQKRPRKKRPRKKRPSQKRPNYTAKSAPFIEFADFFATPTLDSSLQFIKYEFFILKQCFSELLIQETNILTEKPKLTIRSISILLG